MNFRTEITAVPADFRISHSDKIEMLGSCFVESISSKFTDAGFRLDVNPFGIVYNPFSLSNNLNQLLDDKRFTANDLFCDKEIFHSFSHHSRFSGTDPELVLEKINSRLNDSSAFLRNADLLIITFGTAFVYRLHSTGEVVANCHKIPSGQFTYKRLTVEEIVKEWTNLISRLQALRPEMKILFTVSPIRHWKDGAHQNQLSKSTLLLAVDELIKRNSNTYYFPSYEILLDDLRDYRFYADDLLHPSAQAVDYIWEKFSETYFDKQTTEKIREYERIQQALNHRPFHPESEEYKAFIEKAKAQLETFLREREIRG
ncbi:hypothetical protein FACS189415_0290 [Bacteroidia bacterium]|nr:hypothetical protein FACS189426_14710 [Bacteroidia bacterium]GHU81613.1 hypothetical protein FACS189415_0290 [Bacteroidia bacterium]GHV71589.1 hypothetical protein FACS189420_7200 [Bacteroidia bacterium]